ncbi:MAG: SDR family oxidoreductase [Pseudomonadota bacterium]
MSLQNPNSYFDVSGKVALVGGASGAFGSVAARCLSAAGCKVALAARNAQSLAETAESCAGETIQIVARPQDEHVANEIVTKTVEEFGKLDIVIAAAGMNKVEKIDQMAPATFEDIMDANVRQSWLMARAASKQMLEQGHGGKIILMSSARGLLGHPAGYTAYCASKSAVDGITRALGCELGPTGITVNAIAPTVFRSPLTAWMYEDTEHAENVRNGFLTRVPKGRLGEPEDLAGPLLFLASKASDFYTGQVLYADGGYTAG